MSCVFSTSTMTFVGATYELTSEDEKRFETDNLSLLLTFPDVCCFVNGAFTVLKLVNPFWIARFESSAE